MSAFIAATLALFLAAPAGRADFKIYSGNVKNLGANAPLQFDTDWDGRPDIAMCANACLGIGTLTPSANLHVLGNLMMVDGNQAANRVLACNGSGLGAWTDLSSLAGVWSTDGSNVYRSTGSVGIGTTTPTQALHVAGNAIISGNVLISTGNASSSGLIVQGVASQSANLQEWRNSTGLVQAHIAANGGLVVSPWAGNSLSFNGTTIYGRYSGTNRGSIALGQGTGYDIFLIPAASTGKVVIGDHTSGDTTTILGGTSTFNATVRTSILRTPGRGEFMGYTGAGHPLMITSGDPSGTDLNGGNIIIAGGKGTGAGGGGNIIFQTADPLASGSTAQSLSTKMILTTAGRIGLGTISPSANLHVLGNIMMVDGNQAMNRVLATDANGLGAWTDLSSLAGVWSTDGSNVYRSTGSVGIGTTTPTQALHVAGNVLVSGNAVIALDSASSPGLVVRGAASQSGNLLALQDSSGTSLLYFNPASSGDFRIYNPSNTTRYLQITHSSAQSQIVAQSSLYLIANNTTYLSMGGGYGGTTQSLWNVGGLLMQRGTAIGQSEQLSAGQTAADCYISTSKGYDSVGRRDANPVYWITPNGISPSAADTNAGNGGNIMLKFGTGGIATGTGVNGSSGKLIITRVGETATLSNLTEWQSSTNTILTVVDPYGRIGVGASSPSANLHVLGNLMMVDGNQAANRVLACNASGLGAWTDVNSLVSSYWSTSGGNYWLTNGGNIMPRTTSAEDIGSSGNAFLNVYATHFNVLSDARLKTNVRELPYGLREVMGLAPVAYEWKNGRGGTSLGLLAQDVAGVVKEAVSVGDDPQRTMAVRYNELVPVLIKAVQEQQKIVQDQQKVMQDQQAIITGILKELRQLRARQDAAVPQVRKQ